MKKNLLSILMLSAVFAFVNNAMAQQIRFINEVFTNVTVTSNITYDTNVAVNLLNGQQGLPPSHQGPVWNEALKCDIYQPEGDNSTSRPVIILVGTGSFLPAIINNQVTGSKTDSAMVDIARKFAKRGYVVVAANYRLGWNPQTTVQEQAQQQLIQAAFRGIQDVRNCIRFLRNNATMYGIDVNKIIVGGQGTGGYISLGIAAVDKRSDLESSLKFLRGDASPMVNIDTLGDWNGLGGWPYLCTSGDASVSAEAHMTFNYGGAMGDSAWMDANTLPIVGLHCVGDIFAPYGTGNVVVPTTGITVIPNASGAGHIVPKANASGINNKINRMIPSDEVSITALLATNFVNNLYPFRTPVPVEGSPWEFWNKTAVQAITSVMYRGIPLPANGRNADSLSSLTNPLMSENRGRAYCDTIVQFVAPRIALQFDLASSHELDAFSLASPANDATIEIFDDATKTLTVKWNKTSNGSGNPIEYDWILDNLTGNFLDPLFAESVTDEDSIVMTHADVYAALTLMGIGVDQTANLKWTVVADNDVFMRPAINHHNINLTKRKLVGIKENNISSFVSVYPNPATSNISIAMDKGMAAIASIDIMDITGRRVLNFEGLNTHQQNIMLSTFGSGIYFANITNTNGATASVKFIVK